MLGPYPEFCWSISKSRVLSACRREYYWATYGMWGGWDAIQGEISWLAYRLKYLTTPAIQVGILIHDCARDLALLIKHGGGRPDFSRDFSRLQNRCRGALDALYRRTLEDFLRSPKHNQLLHAVYYSTPTDLDKAFEEARERVDAALMNLLECEVWDEVLRCPPKHILVADSRGSLDLPIDEERTDLVKVFAAPDLAFRSPELPTICIVDWKTGTAGEDSRRQLAAYALYLRSQFDISFAEGRFVGRTVSLGDGRVTTYELTRADLVDLVDQIRSDVGVMRALLVDTEKNAPKPIEDFPLRAPEGRKRCRWCNYFELCKDELREAAQPEGPYALLVQ
jgi:hypothetical protein